MILRFSRDKGEPAEGKLASPQLTTLQVLFFIGGAFLGQNVCAAPFCACPLRCQYLKLVHKPVISLYLASRAANG